MWGIEKISPFPEMFTTCMENINSPSELTFSSNLPLGAGGGGGEGVKKRKTIRNPKLHFFVSLSQERNADGPHLKG